MLKRYNLISLTRILIILAAFVIGCSPKSNYNTLSKFFDGVPNPYIADSIRIADSLALAQQLDNQYLGQVEPEYNYHPPYLGKECASCHDQKQMGKLSQPMPGLCYTCHEDYNNQYKVLHGPVDAGFCTECHNPHMQINEKLLIRTGQDLCLSCHSAKAVFKNEVHLDIDDADCTDCHNPHGGDDRFILN